MPKQLNVNMSFTADTGQAKQAIQQLQQDLQKLAYGAPQGIKVDAQSFQLAAASARELAFHLNNAYNTKTGNLDLSKLNASLKQSGTNLTQLTSGFTKAGAVGQQAFVSLAKAVANADMPALSLNTHLQTMLITLKNVARFQISSSIIHGAIGAVKEAYGYAQDLNESLNNIRIVTGQNVDQMARFAEEANKAAKSLSTTTLDYTKASLIYYQQGLSDSDVKARTDVTVKMANVSRQSAEEVSSQMTAIWNNFDNGSKSLEYYTDVITALGASTAASSEEIAGGLSKFAAVADTVGLSYEYAASAMATIVATTRQSEETVGNGLRTIFSRLEGLKLGETLEDGVDLNKYSAALQSIGVNILDVTGNLKDMDSILDETAAHWDNLTQAQKVAFAETVGGVRQYTNLIALLDNWDVMQTNLKTSYESEGTLQKQADIYAESWEAARKRVQAAAEGVYNTLINDDFFIKVDNFLEHLLNGVNSFLKLFGGLGPVLASIGGMVLGMVANKIGPAMAKVAQDIQIITGGADRVYKNIQHEMTEVVNAQISSNQYSGAEEQELRNASQLLVERGKLTMMSKKMTDTEKLRADLAIQGLELEQAAVTALIKKRDELAQKQKANTDNLNSYKEISAADTTKIGVAKSKAFNSKPVMSDKEITDIQGAAQKAENILSGVRSGLIDKFQNNTSGINIVTEGLQKLNTTDLKGVQDQVQHLTQYLDETTFKSKAVQQALQDIENAQGTDQLSDKIQALNAALEKAGAVNLGELFNFSGEINFDGFDEQLTNEINRVEEFKLTLVGDFDEAFNSIDPNSTAMANLVDSFLDGSGNIDAFLEQVKKLGLEGDESVQKFIEKLQQIPAVDMSSIKTQIDVISSGFKDLAGECPDVEKALVNISKAKSPKELQTGLQALNKALKESNIDANKVARVLEKMGIPKSEIQAWQNGKKELAELSKEAEAAQKKLSSIHIDINHMVTGTEVFGKVGAAAMSAYTICNSLQTLFRTWTDPDTTFGEKLTSSLMSVGMLIPAVMSGLSALGAIQEYNAQAATRHAISSLGLVAALGVQEGTTLAVAAAEAQAAAVSNLVATGRDEETAKTMVAIMAKKQYGQAAFEEAIKAQLAAGAITQEDAALLRNTATTNLGSVAKILFSKASLASKQAMLEELLVSKLEEAQKKGETGTTLSLTFAEILLNAVREHGLKGVLIGLAVGAAVIATAVATIAIIKAETKARLENATAAAEQASASAKATEEKRKEQIETEKNLKNIQKTYQEAVKNGDDLTEVTKELDSATLKAAEAYEIENAQLMIAAGLYDELNKKIQKQSELQGEAAERALKRSLDSASVAFGEKLDHNGTGAYWGWKDEVGIEGATGSKSDTFFIEAIKELKDEKAYGELVNKIKMSTGDLNVGISSESAEGYIQMYEAVQATLDRALENAAAAGVDLSDTNLYKNTIKYLEDLKDTYNQLKEASDKLQDITLDNLFVSSDEITNIDEYQTAIETYTNKLLEQKDRAGKQLYTEAEARKTAENYLKLQYEDFALENEALKGVRSGTAAEHFKELWANSSDFVKQKLLEAASYAELINPEIDLDYEAVTAAADEAERLERALLGATQVKGWDSIISDAKKGKKTAEEWAQIYNDNTELLAAYDEQGKMLKDDAGNPIMSISKADWLLMTDTQRTEYARQQKENWKAYDEAQAKERADIANANLSTLEQDKKDTAAAAKAAHEDVTNYEGNKGSFKVVKQNGETVEISADKYQAAVTARTAYDEAVAGYQTGEVNYEQLVAAYNTTLTAMTDAGLSMIDGTATALQNAEFIQDEAYADLVKVADSADAAAQQAQNKYDSAQEDINYYNTNYNPSDEQKATNQALDLRERIDDAGLKYDDVEKYATQLAQLKDPTAKATQDTLELAFATMQQAEASGISSKEILEYADTLSEMDAFSKLSEAELTELSLSMQQLAKDTELNKEDIANYTNELMKLDEFEGESAETVAQFATAVLQQKRGIDSLSKGYSTWKKHLKDTAEHTDEWAEAQKGAKKAVSDILGLPLDKISDNFVNAAEEAGLLEKAATGDQEAIAELGRLAIKDALADSFDGSVEELDNLLLGLQTDADGNPIKITTSLDNSDALTSLAELSQSAAMTAEEISDHLSEAGWKPQISYEELPFNVTGTTTDGQSIITYTDSSGVSYTRTIDSQAIGNAVNGKLSLPVIDGGKTHFKGSGGGGSSGGGGGGGGDKKPPKPERYHVIKNKIQNNDRRTSTVTRNKDRAFGTAKLDLLKEEQKLREKNLELQQQYAKEIEDWLAKDKEDLIKAYQDLGLAVEFDEDGEISNFEELQQAYLDAFEDLDEEGEEAWKDAQEALEQYEESLDLLNDKLDEIEQAAQEAFDALLEEVELKVQLDVDISDDKMAYLDYLLEKIDDDAYAAAQAIALLGDKTAETMRKIETYQNGINDILNLHGLTMDDLNNLSPDELRNLGLTDQEVSDLREYRDALLDANKELLEMRTTIVDKVIDAFEQLNEKVQKAYEKFDQYNSVLEHYKNLSDLLVPSLGKQSKMLMDQLNNAMFDNAKNQAAAARKVYEEAQKQWAEAKAGYDAAVASGDDNAIREYERILDTLTENLNEAQDNWLSAWEASLEQAQVIFEAAIEDIQAEYDAALGGTFGSLDYLQQAYDRQKELNDQYLQDYDRLYELSKLSRNISAAIDDTDSIKAKERLRALQAEINKLQADGTKLSEYDVQVLEKRFEIEKARLALDDAQNAKSQVRLQRDAEGNWGYVYTADEDAVAKAEQEYEDKLHEYQQLNDEYITQLQDQALEVQAQYRDAYMEIMNDTSLTDEERKARVDELNNWLAGQMNFFNEQLEHALTNQHSTLQRYYDAYGDLNAQLVDTWGETTLAEVLGMETMEGFMGNWQGAVDQMISAAAAAWENYRRQQDEANEAAGVSTEDVADHIASQISAIGTYSDEAKDQVSQLSEELTGEFTEAMKAALEWEEKYAQAIDDAVNKNEAFIISLNKMITALAGLEGQISWDFSGVTQSSEQFGSGGYTGAWGPNGKLAVLHEKELVLNKEDTAKFLDALQILKMIDLSANWMQQGFGDFIGAPTIGELAQTLDQQVSINASFPGVKDRYEIEEAFNNLVNKASQYANRKESY